MVFFWILVDFWSQNWCTCDQKTGQILAMCKKGRQADRTLNTNTQSMFLWSHGRKNRARLSQKFDENLMRILTAKIIDFLEEICLKLRPWAVQTATKNEAKNGAENRVEKGHAGNASHARKIGRGGWFPLSLFPAFPATDTKNLMNTPLRPQARWRILSKFCSSKRAVTFRT